MEREDYRKRAQESFPRETSLVGVPHIKARSLRYGWNPGVPAAFYRDPEASGPCVGAMKVLQENPEKPLGHINLEDIDLVTRVVRSLTEAFPEDTVSFISKHVNSTGAARGKGTQEQVFLDTWQTNYLACFGGIVGINVKLEEGLAEILASKEYVIECVVAPSYSPGALELLKRKKDLRVVAVGSFHEPVIDANVEARTVRGGYLVQPAAENSIHSVSQLMNVVTEAQPTPLQLEALLFNWIVCYYTRSNAIVIGDNNLVAGIGAGQMSRVDSEDIAINYALNRSKRGTEGKVLASDAFFPFRDGIDHAAAAHIPAIVVPMGSLGDKAVIQAANEQGIAMVDPGVRGFRH